MAHLTFPQSDNTARIWLSEPAAPDTYAEFYGTFSAEKHQKITLCITADSAYAVYLNGSLAAFSACGDYPDYKLYDCVDISNYCSEDNELRIQVWYIGEDTQTYLVGDAGLAFEITSSDKLLLQSGDAMHCRRLTAYRHLDRMITSQLGRGFHYDNTAKNVASYSACALFPVWENLLPRTTAPLKLGEAAEAVVTPLCDGYLIDLGKETVGFLSLNFTSSSKQKLVISYGEHLVNGAVPRIIGARDFSVEYTASVGENAYLNPFRRLAGRYLQITCRKPIALRECSLRPVYLPMPEQAVEVRDSLDKAIYNACVNTLKCCMHEHYEDCPWREQAMYLMDSRNQMLSGYYAFSDTNYQRDMLLLISHGQRSDGLFDLCFPAGVNFPIPFFSLVYLMLLDEYVSHTGDLSVLADVSETAHRLMNAFDSRVEENGLIADFPYPFWNFYEWADESHHESEINRKETDTYQKRYDIILNAMYVHAKELYGKLFGASVDLTATKQAIEATFFVPSKHLFKLSTEGEAYSVLGNSMALLIGLGDKLVAEHLTADDTLIPVTLSMAAFFYDALLRFGDTFRPFIINDLRRKYQKMLDEGTDTVWETTLGWHDFDNAGSLCHGWSAIPVYYLHLLGLAGHSDGEVK